MTDDSKPTTDIVADINDTLALIERIPYTEWVERCKRDLHRAAQEIEELREYQIKQDTWDGALRIAVGKRVDAEKRVTQLKADLERVKGACVEADLERTRLREALEKIANGTVEPQCGIARRALGKGE